MEYIKLMLISMVPVIELKVAIPLGNVIAGTVIFQIAVL